MVTIRKKIVIELFKTESVYINDLGIITKYFRKPLEDAGMISEEQSKTLFANVDQLPAINQNLMIQKMNQKMDEAEAQKKDVGNIVLGDIFIELSKTENLERYTEYCVNQPQALSLLSQLEKNDADFSSYTKKLQDSEPAVRGLSLGSYLIKPVQRLCKYPLLIRELMAQTDQNDEEYKRLAEAAEKVGEAVKNVNEVQRKADEAAALRIAEINDLAQKIDGAESIGLSDGDPNRLVVKTAEVQSIAKKGGKAKPRTLILFNSQLAVLAPKAEAKKASKFVFDIEWHCKITDLALLELPDNESQGIKDGFQLANRAAKKDDISITILCKDAVDKKDWVEEIKKYINMYQRQEAKRRKGLPDPDPRREPALIRGAAARGTIQVDSALPKRRSSSDPPLVEKTDLMKVGKTALSLFSKTKSRPDLVRGSKKTSKSKDEKMMWLSDPDEEAEASISVDTTDVSLSSSFKDPLPRKPSTDVLSADVGVKGGQGDEKPVTQTRSLSLKTAPPAEPAPLPTSKSVDVSYPTSDTSVPLQSPSRDIPKGQGPNFNRPVVGKPVSTARPKLGVVAPSIAPQSPPTSNGITSPRKVAESVSSSSPPPATSFSPFIPLSPSGPTTENAAVPRQAIGSKRTTPTSGNPPTPSPTGAEPSASPDREGSSGKKQQLTASAPAHPVSPQPSSSVSPQPSSSENLQLPTSSATIVTQSPPVSESPWPSSATATADSQTSSNPEVIDALIRACAEGPLDRVKNFVEKNNPNINGKNADLRTPIHLAASYGRMDIVKFLIHKGAQVNVVDRYNVTPMKDAERFGFVTIGKLLHAVSQHPSQEPLPARPAATLAAAASGIPSSSPQRPISGDITALPSAAGHAPSAASASSARPKSSNQSALPSSSATPTSSSSEKPNSPRTATAAATSSDHSALAFAGGQAPSATDTSARPKSSNQSALHSSSVSRTVSPTPASPEKPSSPRTTSPTPTGRPKSSPRSTNLTPTAGPMPTRTPQSPSTTSAKPGAPIARSLPKPNAAQLPLMPAQEGQRPRGRSRSNPALKYQQQAEASQQEQLAQEPQQELSIAEAKKVYHHSRKAPKPEMTKEVVKEPVTVVAPPIEMAKVDQ